MSLTINAEDERKFRRNVNKEVIDQKFDEIKNGWLFIMEIEFSKQSLAKISKHSVSVFPLEGYGFLIGTQEIIYAAIPTGKTTKWGNATDRFSELDMAYPKAEVLAEEGVWIVRTSYDSH